MSASSVERMKGFIVENFEDIEEELKDRSEICEFSASEFDSMLHDNPLGALAKVQDNPLILIKSGYYIVSISDLGGEDWVSLSTKPDGYPTSRLMIKEYYGIDWSTSIYELKKGDRITFIIKGNTAYVEGIDLCASCVDLYVCDSPNDIFFYPTIALSEDAPIGPVSMSIISKYKISSGKLIDRRIYEEYKASKISNKKIYNEESDGCYIATCVYGTYDCPPLWTLRRFRDDFLKSIFIGRLFIKFYYCISPHLVSWFGESIWFQIFWKTKLDYFVSWLNRKGIQNTAYDDRY